MNWLVQRPVVRFTGMEPTCGAGCGRCSDGATGNPRKHPGCKTGTDPLDFRGTGIELLFNILVLRAGSSSAVRAAQIEFENILALIAHVDTPIRTARNTVDL